MIDLIKLDKNLTYVGYQYGQGAISRAIQLKSKMLTNCDLPAEKIASHVYALIFQNDDWYIFESHLKWNGVKKLLFADWVKGENLDNNFVFPYSLSIPTLELYAKFNPGYSLGEIGEIAFSSFGKNQLKCDLPGMICSEYVALAMLDHKPCFKFNVASSKTIPLHIQLLDNTKG